MNDNATQYEYALKDLAKLMVRDQDITEGHWMPMLRFTHAAATIETPDGAGPAAINRVTAIGLSRVDKPNDLSVDAAEIASSTKH